MIAGYNWLANPEYDPIPEGQETAIVQAAQAGDEKARTELIHRNLRFVAKMAMDYFRVTPWDFDELFQRGASGLIHAIPRFQPEKGVKFLSYARYWIKNRILSDKDTGKAIDIPIRVQREISQNVGNSFFVSLDRELNLENSKGSLIDSFVDPEAESAPISALLSEYSARELNYALLKLSKKQRDVLCLRFGLTTEDSEPLSYTEIGKRLRISPNVAQLAFRNAMHNISVYARTSAWNPSDFLAA